MKTILSFGYDFIIKHDTHIKNNSTATVIDGDPNNKIWPLESRVESVDFYTPNGVNEYGNIVGGYHKITLSKTAIIELASKINYIQSVSISDGVPSYNDDDLPF